MSETEYRSPEEQIAAEAFNNKNEKIKPEGVARALTGGTFKGGAEAAATMGSAIFSDGPVQPAELFEDEKTKASGRAALAEASRASVHSPEDNVKQKEGEGQQESKQESTEEKQQKKRVEKAAKSGRERSQPPGRAEPQQEEQNRER